MPFTQSEFRRTLGLFATGVTIVTTRKGSVVHGMTVNSFTSVSLDPPLVLICIGREHSTHALLEESGIFAVNILRADQRELSERFAKGEPASRLEGLAYEELATGAPILRDCLAFLDCRIEAAYPGGDHTIFLGRVEALGIKGRGVEGEEVPSPLIFFAGRYASLAL